MTLNQRIGKFYDQSTPIWLDVWGEHMHHGYYGPNGDQPKEKVQAQIDMIETILDWGKIKPAKRMLDAGCGVGGSARYLANKYNAEALGFTLSQVQVDRAQQYNEAAHLSDRVRIEKRNMMTLNETDGDFGFIWSMESAEHIEDKAKLFQLFYDRLQPGGQLLMATWCHRKTPPEITTKEQRLLDKVYRLYHLPPMVDIPSLTTFADQAGFSEVETDDWTKAIAPFWKTVVKSALQPNSIIGLIKSGTQTIAGAWAMRYMIEGYRMGLIKFGVLRATKK